MASLSKLYTLTQRLLWNIKNNHQFDLDEAKVISTGIYKLASTNLTTPGKIHYNKLSNTGDVHIHSVNVALLSGCIGIDIEMEVNIIKKMILGGLLHDVGKLFTVPAILDKPGRLDSIEKGVMGVHTLLGHEVVKQYITDEIVISIIKNHHEEEYLSKNEDNVPYRCTFITSIADKTDAILSMRCYKDAQPPQKAIEEINKRYPGHQYVDLISKYILNNKI